MQQTPEMHLNTLMSAILREVQTHGPASLAEVIASTLDLADTDDNSAAAQQWRTARDAFAGMAATLPARPLPALFNDAT